jgi:hypothetical protein
VEHSPKAEMEDKFNNYLEDVDKVIQKQEKDAPYIK